MLPQLPAAVRVFLCTRPTDLRKSFDALSGLVQECFGQDPLAGHLLCSSIAAAIGSRSSDGSRTGW
jgi:IS66 Orf2 like protein